ncbi:hypothetical protein GCM10023205_26780 [Yinghuangia aomiensis]|uniref:VOC family protein n=1 Tax=Yinghuangia aomiensis TaxID=676205 RepID=A0ABP9H4S6_9ACTN
MADARVIPILPCASIDEITDFHTALGFEVTYRQTRPNPYVALRRGSVELHYNGIAGFRAEDSYGSCLVAVPDTEPLFEAFAAGLRTKYGRLPLAGFPRITRPRRRKNYGGLSGFSLIDPSGNWIRVVRAEPDVPQDAGSDASAEPESAPATTSRLAAAHANAVVTADSRGDVAQAAKSLSGAVDRPDPTATPADRVEALAFLAELHLRLDDPAQAHARLDELDRLTLSPTDRENAATALAQAAEIRDLTGVATDTDASPAK